LGNTIGVKNIDNCFLEGILNDLGKLIFLKIFPDQYADIFQTAIKSKIKLVEIEKKVLGISSSVAGELLAEKWQLPKSIRDTIKYKNVGMVEGRFDTITACVHLANICAEFLSLGLTTELRIPKPNKHIWNELKLPSNFFIENREKIIKDYFETSELLLKS
jgi:HD-like signal output (HDOD) protein